MSHIRHFIRKLYSKILFGHVDSLVKLGKSKTLESIDLPDLPTTLDPRHTPKGFDELSLRSGWPFLFSVLKATRSKMIVIGVLLISLLLFNLTSPFLLKKLLTLLPEVVGNEGMMFRCVGWALLLCFSSVLEALIIQHYVFHAVSAIQIATNGLNKRIYATTLRLSSKSMNKYETGDVVNYMSTDSAAVADITFWAPDALYTVFLVIFVSIALLFNIGLSALFGIALLAIVSPWAKYIAKKFTKIDHEILQLKDERVSLISQVLGAIRVVKFFSWEKQYLQKIKGVRDQEVEKRRRLATISGVSSIVIASANVLVSVVVFAAYALLGNKLDAATVFSTMALFALLEHPFGHLTNLISEIIQAKVSADRLAKYLSETVTDHPIVEDRLAGATTGIEISNLSFQFDPTLAKIDLADISISIAAGSSVAIVGPVGCGKTTLLQTLIGELIPQTGKISFATAAKPRTGFVDQHGFIQSNSLMHNITFGNVVDLTLLDEVIAACALAPDLALFPAGIYTELGEHGVNLSGGQKLRVGLARAAFDRPQLLILDDPLSAVDPDTEEHLVDQLLFGMWALQTRVVSTHRLKNLYRFDHIVFMEHGRITAQGTLDRLLEMSERFRDFYDSQRDSLSKIVTRKITPLVPTDHTASLAANARITDEEDREKGAVDLKMYLAYFKSLGGFGTRGERFAILSGLMIITLLATLAPICQNLWLAFWTDGKTAGIGSAASDSTSIMTNVWVLLGFGLMVVLFGCIRQIFWSLRAVETGKIIHERSLSAVFNTKIRFFDATPIGRILNRFSRDVDAVERNLFWSFQSMVQCGLQVIASLVLILTNLPMIIVAIVPMYFVYRKVQDLYRCSCREVQRMYAISRSPRFAHFKETLSGLATIRAFDRQNWYWQKFYDTLAENQKIFHGLIQLNRWFSLRIPILSAVVAAATGVCIVVFARYEMLSIGIAGLVITYSLRFWDQLNWTVRSFCETEANMTSYERLHAYLDLPSEVDVSGDQPLPANSIWPTHGDIRFEEVRVRYAEHLPDVLQSTSFAIQGGKKTAIVGRTGSGKSTIIQCLFRLITPHAGRILIDGVDIANIPLERLRRNLAIIPQMPMLFKGSLRQNLDRFDEYEDSQVWRALRLAHIEKKIAALPGALNYELVEGGVNLSHGERQLVCLARAILLDASIIVMDEATASVDVETDQLIQQTICTSFVGKTLVIIAHRLSTVEDCDYTIEMIQGSVKSEKSRQTYTIDPSMCAFLGANESVGIKDAPRH